MKHIFIILAFVLLIGVITAYPGEIHAGYYYFADHTKYSGNPVVPYGDDDWDYDKHYPSVIYNATWPVESRFRGWYAGVDEEANICTCYAYSTDGNSWVKPNLGLFEYEGSSNNNIVLEPGVAQTDVEYIDGTYVILVGEDTNKPTTRHAVDIYTSNIPDGNFTLAKELPVKIGEWPGIYHGMNIEQRPDGRWYVYYQYRDENNYRSIGAYLSDTTALSGTWEDLGVLLEHNGPTEQRYSIDIFTYDSKIYGAVLNYDSVVSDTCEPIALWDSDDGENFRYLYDWIGLGENGQWDDTILIQGKFVDLGEEWRFYYSGGQETHWVIPHKMAIGYVHNATVVPNFLSCMDGKAILTSDGKFIYIG